MIRTTIRRASLRPLAVTRVPRRLSSHATNAATESQAKREGDISDSFASLSGVKDVPLPDQFRVLKASLAAGREENIIASWDRLLERLKVENEIVATKGSKVIPEIRYDHLEEDLRNSREEIKKRGAAIIRGVVPEDEARGYKFELDEYIRKNPQTKGETDLQSPHYMSKFAYSEFLNYRLPQQRSSSMGTLLFGTAASGTPPP